MSITDAALRERKLARKISSRLTESTLKSADGYYVELLKSPERLLSPLQPEIPVVEMKISIAHTPSSKQSGFWICRLISEHRIVTEIAAYSFTSPEALAVNAALYGFKALRRPCNVFFSFNHEDLGQVVTSMLDTSAQVTVELGKSFQIMGNLRNVRELNDLLAAAEEHTVIGLGRSWFRGNESSAPWNEAFALVAELDRDANWGCPFSFPAEASVSQ